MPRPIVFLDDGGVMNDNSVRGPQWQRLVGEFFPPLLGGEPGRWAEANWIVATRLWEETLLGEADLVDAAYDAWVRAYALAWLRGMCREVDVPAPAEDACLDLVHRAWRHVTARVRSAYPGAAEAIRTLHARGYRLHTASGEDSTDLDGYLTGMGVRHCFGRLYGPNLVKAHKTAPAYHARVFADAGVEPAEALVVDDSPRALAWAARLGARTVLVGAADGEHEPDLRVASLAELPAVIETRTNDRRQAPS